MHIAGPARSCVLYSPSEDHYALWFLLVDTKVGAGWGATQGATQQSWQLSPPPAGRRSLGLAHRPLRVRLVGRRPPDGLRRLLLGRRGVGGHVRQAQRPGRGGRRRALRLAPDPRPARRRPQRNVAADARPAAARPALLRGVSGEEEAEAAAALRVLGTMRPSLGHSLQGSWPSCSEGGGMFAAGGRWFVMAGAWQRGGCCCCP